MKLNRREKKRENDNLDLFLSFVPKLVKNLQKGKETILTDAQGESFRHVYNFLERDFTNRRVTGVRVKGDKIERAQEMFKNKKSVSEIEKTLKISTATVYRYLEAPQVAEKKAEEKRQYDEQIKIFLRLSEKEIIGEITGEHIEQIKNGMEIVHNSRKVAKTRSANLAAGREKLKE